MGRVVQGFCQFRLRFDSVSSQAPTTNDLKVWICVLYYPQAIQQISTTNKTWPQSDNPDVALRYAERISRRLPYLRDRTYPSPVVNFYTAPSAFQAILKPDRDYPQTVAPRKARRHESCQARSTSRRGHWSVNPAKLTMYQRCLIASRQPRETRTAPTLPSEVWALYKSPLCLA